MIIETEHQVKWLGFQTNHATTPIVDSGLGRRFTAFLRRSRNDELLGRRETGTIKPLIPLVCMTLLISMTVCAVWTWFQKSF